MIAKNNKHNMIYEILNKSNGYMNYDNIRNELWDYDLTLALTINNRQIRRIVCEINCIADFENIIVSGRKGYKVADKEEATKYIDSRIKRDKRSLWRNSIMAKKLQMTDKLTLDEN